MIDHYFLILPIYKGESSNFLSAFQKCNHAWNWTERAEIVWIRHKVAPSGQVIQHIRATMEISRRWVLEEEGGFLRNLTTIMFADTTILSTGPGGRVSIKLRLLVRESGDIWRTGPPPSLQEPRSQDQGGIRRTQATWRPRTELTRLSTRRVESGI